MHTHALPILSIPSLTPAVKSQVVTEPYAFDVCPLAYPANATVVATSVSSGAVLAVSLAVGAGHVVVSATPDAVVAAAVTTPTSKVDVTLPTPYPLARHVELLLVSVLNQTVLFDLQVRARR